MEVVSSQLHTAYTNYSGQSISTVLFARLLQERGFTKYTSNSGHTRNKVVWRGLEIKADDITRESFTELANELGGIVILDNA